MKQRQTNSIDPQLDSDSVQPEDALVPREESRKTFHPSKKKSSRKLERKGAQLCAQIRRSLEFVVPEVLVDTKFDAMVLDVQPAPNTSHLLVLLRATEALDETACRHLEMEVTQRAGVIRTAVAQSIHRKKTPSLSFRVIPT